MIAFELSFDIVMTYVRQNQYITVPPAVFGTKPKQSVTIYSTQTVTIAMVTSCL